MNWKLFWIGFVIISFVVWVVYKKIIADPVDAEVERKEIKRYKH